MTDITRRASLLTLAGAASALITRPAFATVPAVAQSGARNISSLRALSWRDHFDRLGKGGIIADLPSRALYYWSADGPVPAFPTSIPLSEDLTRRGRTGIVRKRPARTGRRRQICAAATPTCRPICRPGRRIRRAPTPFVCPVPPV